MEQLKEKTSRDLNELASANDDTESLLEDFWRKFKKQRLALVSAMFILLLVILAFIGPYIIKHDVAEPNYDKVLQTPSFEHWAGTDEFGRDIFSRIIVGTRISLSIGFFSVLIGALI